MADCIRCMVIKKPHLWHLPLRPRQTCKSASVVTYCAGKLVAHTAVMDCIYPILFMRLNFSYDTSNGVKVAVGFGEDEIGATAWLMR